MEHQGYGMLKRPRGKIIHTERGFEALYPSPEPSPYTSPALISQRLNICFSLEKKQTTKSKSGAEIGFFVLWPALVITQLSARL